MRSSQVTLVRNGAELSSAVWFFLNEHQMKRILAIGVVLCSQLVACRHVEEPLPQPRNRLDSALTEAVKSNRASVVAELLSRGADANAITAPPHDGSTPLIIAAREGYEVIARSLIAAGADVNGRQYGTFEGLTPLMVAAGGGHTNIVQLLLSHHAYVNRRSGPRGTGCA